MRAPSGASATVVAFQTSGDAPTMFCVLPARSAQTSWRNAPAPLRWAMTPPSDTETAAWKLLESTPTGSATETALSLTNPLATSNSCATRTPSDTRSKYPGGA